MSKKTIKHLTLKAIRGKALPGMLDHVLECTRCRDMVEADLKPQERERLREWRRESAERHDRVETEMRAFEREWDAS